VRMYELSHDLSREAGVMLAARRRIHLTPGG
jgi:hypothetical protein